MARDEVMQLAKINSKATYHKAMGYLHQQDYIDYKPSYNPYKGSKIKFFPKRTGSANEPVQNLNTRPLNEPSNKLYSTNIINNISPHSIDSQKSKEQKIASSKNGVVDILGKEKSSAKKENQIPPHPDTVEQFFINQSSTIQEARRFINHYTANGWLVGGKSPMKDWKASAKNWITNTLNYNRHANHQNTNRAMHLNTANKKNYYEPL